MKVCSLRGRRSLLAVLEFFPQVLPPSSPSPKGHDHSHHHHHEEHHHEERRGKEHKHEHRRGSSLTLGGAQEWDDDDGDDNDAGGAAASSTSSSRRLLHKGGVGKGLSVCDPPGVVANLQSLFKNLGQVNNQVRKQDP